MAKSEQQKLKGKLDTVFSQYIRLRDADDRGYCSCITCGSTRYWEKDGMQNGHYIQRGCLATRFDEDNCHAQCDDCNLWKNKNMMQITYREELIEKIGEDRVVALERKRHQIALYDVNWYREKIDHYTKLVDKLRKHGKVEEEQIEA